jgi:hypothetical protein
MATVPTLGSDSSPRAYAASKTEAPLGRTRGLRNRSRDSDPLAAAPPGGSMLLGSLSAPSTHAALAAFQRGEAIAVKRRGGCCVAIALLSLSIIILTAFLVPRAPSVSVSSTSATTGNTREDVVVGRFAMTTSATFTVNNENFFAMQFQDVLVSAKSPTTRGSFASWASASSYTVPARSKRAFTIYATFNTLTGQALTNAVEALSFALAATQTNATGGSLAGAEPFSLLVSTSMTPVWLSMSLPKANIDFSVPVTKV